jgi:hypothetical protein
MNVESETMAHFKEQFCYFPEGIEKPRLSLNIVKKT